MDSLNDKNKTCDIKKYHREYRLENIDKYKERDIKRYWKNKLANKHIDINTIQTDNLNIDETVQLYRAILIKHKMAEINPKILERI
jgi:hypothetical protein